MRSFQQEDQERFEQHFAEERQRDRESGDLSRENRVIAWETAQAEIKDDNAWRDISINKNTRDALIFNGRQDSAHALLNTMSILRRLSRAEKGIGGIIVFDRIIMIAVVILWLWHR